MQRLLGTTFVGLSLYSDFLIYSITKKLAVKTLNRNFNQSVTLKYLINEYTRLDIIAFFSRKSNFFAIFSSFSLVETNQNL